MRERLKRLEEATRRLPAQGAILSAPENMLYFAGFTGEGLVAIGPEGRWVFTDFRYVEQAEAETEGFHVVDYAGRDMYRCAMEALDGCESVAIEDEKLTVAEMNRLASEKVRFVNFGMLLDELREIKDESEFRLLRRAAATADQALAQLLGVLKVGMTEKQVAAELEYRMRCLGAEGPSFSTIAASGPNSSKPHAVPGDREIRPGDLLTLDFGCKIGHYCSDMTRTVAFGHLDDDLHRVYDTVLTAQLMALDALACGKTGREIDKVARDYIDEQGYKGCFGHGLGHGVGLLIHEQPRLTSSAAGDKVLRPGHVVTVEPGVYIPGRGGVRIEDMCLMTKDGFINCCSSPKELLVL